MAEPTADEGRGRHMAKLAIGAALGIAALLLVGRLVGGYLPGFAEWVDGLGFWGPVVFVVGYAAAVVAFAPGGILTIAAGVIFGLSFGTLYAFTAAVIGSSLAFLVARYLARGWVEAKVAGHPTFAAIDREIGRQGRRIVFLLRLSPAFPFNLLNYALGLTQVRFADYLVAAVGMLPGTLLYVYLGRVAGDLAAAAGGASRETGPAGTVLLGVGLVATAVVVTIVTRIARRALAEATAPGAVARPAPTEAP